MGALVLSVVGPLLPYLLLVIGGLGAYFGIKHKGKSEAKVEFQKQQEQASQQLKKTLQTAESKDQVIDQKVEEKISEIKSEHQVPVETKTDDGTFKF